MKKLIVIFGLLTVGVVCLNVGLANTEGDDLAQLKMLNAKFIHNFVTNDAVSHDKIIHEKFQYINCKANGLTAKTISKTGKPVLTRSKSSIGITDSKRSRSSAARLWFVP